ncbi:hypothetical protein HPB50_012487 [Hyalomma asiaticum]|uniref:Uncharacterized protein n=1 Tax=Hyalomma asiaticum TaxID=266040 RepID=A0ACB7SDW2_HYAAI|nr:hypothetical protein HPB50_012487 [Hyalomma asiaticum]
MQRIRQTLLLLCAFASALIVGVQLGLNMNNVPLDSSEHRLQHSPTPRPKKKTDSPYFTEDGAEWIDMWTKVSTNVYVYSAYLDPRLGANATVVRLVGLMRLHPTLKVNCSCLIDDLPEKPAQPVVAKVEFLQDHHHAKYDGVFITCPYNLTNDFDTPRTVRVTVTGAETGTSKRIPVHYRTSSRGEHELDSLALVRPAFLRRRAQGPRPGALLGLLLTSRRPEVHLLLPGLQRRRERIPADAPRTGIEGRLLSLVPTGSQEVLGTGPNVFTQDCLYRHANASRRVLIVDLDEFVFPLPVNGKRRTIAELVARLPASKACLVVRNVFWVRTGSAVDRPFIFASLNRSRRVWPTGLRSKYFADPLGVLEGGIHFCRRFLSGVRARDKQMTVSGALLFHYRRYGGETYARDTSMLVWREPMMASPLMQKAGIERRSVAYRLCDALRNSFDVVLRLVW